VGPTASLSAPFGPVNATLATAGALAARAKRADLIVIGTHGGTGIGKFFLGSVASRVVATAAYPVLTVRAK
jgi:nucleotide-binding universal stress UspA family protein